MKTHKSWNITIVLALLSFTTFIIFLLISLAPNVNQMKPRNRGGKIIEKGEKMENHIHIHKDSLTLDFRNSHNKNYSSFFLFLKSLSTLKILNLFLNQLFAFSLGIKTEKKF